MDLAKFVWLLKESALYFPRADLLGDPHEGALPRLNVEARDRLTARAPTPGSSILNAESREDDERSHRLQPWVWAPGIDPTRPSWITNVAHVFVSCWNLSEYESAVLWSLYGKGIAIESTFAGLRDGLTTPEPVYIGRVTYIDYENDFFPADNGYHAIVHKRRYFEAEKELRAVIPGQTHADPEDDGIWTGDPRTGIAATVDLTRLVRRVWVAPGKPLIRDVVVDLVSRYGLGVEVRQSSLDDTPRY
jgi:hypothetical protein